MSWSRTVIASLIALGTGTVACAASRSRGQERRVLDIAPERRRCVGEAVQQCLVVRWGGDSLWQNFYDEIEGFTPVAGVRYRLLVERIPVPRPPADGSSHRYRLVRECGRLPAGRVPGRIVGGAQCE